MCGIAGIIGSNSFGNQLLKQMIACLHHRGPDHTGLWISDHNQVGFCHARLAVQDISSNGNQPMASKSGRYKIVYNGEIYNHNDLRAKLAEHYNIKWDGFSDTETLLALVDNYGLHNALNMIKGMFAFALFDQHSNKVYLARDRFGEKPLYYGKVNSNWVFASELSPFPSVPGFSAEINRYALQLYLQYNSIPAPQSIFKDIWKVEPGQVIAIRIDNNSIEKEYYWEYETLITKNPYNYDTTSFNDLMSQLDLRLTRAVSSQLISDVPLGAFLSGGIDSSLIAAIAQKNSSNNLKTFSIGFDIPEYNEAEHAANVAKHLGTEHREIYVSSNDALDVIPKLNQIYDEPFADSSQIPTYLVSKAARGDVTVCLSGDAADELFGGYNRYLAADQIWGKLSKVPQPVRIMIARLMKTIKPSTYSKISASILGPQYGDIGDKIHKALPMMGAHSVDDLYKYFVSQIPDTENWLLNASALPVSHFELRSNNHLPNLSSVELMMLKDIKGYLPTDILAKVDRAAMSISLETRVPFLDVDVVEFAARLPLKHKIKGQNKKHILRQLLYQYVPQDLVDRPKMGFGVPLASWLRGPLREWAESLLSEEKLKDEGYFNPTLVRAKWLEHLSGKRNWQHQLWNVIMFQSWLNRFKKDTKPFIIS